VVTPSLYHMFKAYTEFQKLKRVMIGKSLSSSIVESDMLKDKLTPTTKRLLIDLLDETEEDYQNLIKICEEFGTEVVRPEYGVRGNTSPYLMNPRDDCIVLDETLVCTQPAMGTTVDYIHTVKEEKEQVLRNKNTFGLIPPSIFRLGEDIIFDRQENMVSNSEKSVEYIKKWLEPLGYRIIYKASHEFNFKAGVSHADGCLSLQKPGVLLTCSDAKTYTENLFKNWDACEVDSGRQQLKDWMKFKKDTRSYVFEDDKYLDASWNSLITTWFSDWVGYAEETVFDVNVLSLDEEHVIVSNYNKDVFQFFKKHKIEPIISPWRHRFFWDGGIHCITLDLEREGPRERYL
jgi:N-dimethylarginine dimethylaminohydrolase